MNIRIDAPDLRLNEHFFRTADRMRVEGCVNAVAHEGLSLALSCMHEALLDHYVQILLQRLRQSSPALGIEVYFPANTESLIARFNEALASQSVRQATRSSSEASPPQVWLVHDAQQLPPQELQLLARLIQNFPGANIRAVLLMIGSPPPQEALSAFGRKLLRWDIEGPTDEQAEATLELARHQGQGDAIALLLRRMGKQRARPATEPSEPTDAPTSGSTPMTVNAPADGSAISKPTARAWRVWSLPRWAWPRLPAPRALWQSLQQQPAFPLDKLRQRGPLLGVATGALALSVLIMMWIQPASFGLKGKGRTATADAPAVATAKTSPQGTQTPVTSVSAAPPAPTPIDVPDPAADAQAWVRTLPPLSFLIQHGTLPTYDKAQQMQKSYASLRDARIVAAYRPGEKLAHFVVVSGPFEPVGKAYERISKKDLPTTSWVRSTQSLQQQLAAPAQESR